MVATFLTGFMSCFKVCFFRMTLMTLLICGEIFTHFLNESDGF